MARPVSSYSSVLSVFSFTPSPRAVGVADFAIWEECGKMRLVFREVSTDSSASPGIDSVSFPSFYRTVLLKLNLVLWYFGATGRSV